MILMPAAAAVAVLAGSTVARSEEFPADPAIDAIFREWDRPDSPGCAIAVINGAEVIYAKGYGSAQLEYAIPITPRTVFHVASVSKQFTAFSVVLLATRGELNLDDEVRKYIPELSDFGEPITIRHLIHHTSGIRDQWSLLQLAGWRMDDVITHDHVMQLVRQQRELNFLPGARYLYSNTGYTLLAEIVHRVSGKPLKEFAKEEIFEPLGMEQTHFHDDHRHIVPDRAYSYYSTTGGGWEKAVLSYAVAGATSLFATVNDLARWQDNFVLQEVGGEEAIELMLTRGVLNNGHGIVYAAGIIHGEYRGLPTLAHSGGDAGFRSRLIRFPDQDMSFVVLSNTTADASALAHRLADLYLEDEFAEPTDGPSVVEQLIANHSDSAGETAADVPAPPLDLEPFLGLYYSDEVKMETRLLQNGDSYVLRPRFGTDMPLTSVEGDTFSAELGTLRFAPASESDPMQMFVSTGRVLNLRFRHVDRIPDVPAPGE